MTKEDTRIKKQLSPEEQVHDILVSYHNELLERYEDTGEITLYLTAIDLEFITDMIQEILQKK